MRKTNLSNSPSPTLPDWTWLLILYPKYKGNTKDNKKDQAHGPVNGNSIRHTMPMFHPQLPQ